MCSRKVTRRAALLLSTAAVLLLLWVAVPAPAQEESLPPAAETAAAQAPAEEGVTAVPPPPRSHLDPVTVAPRGAVLARGKLHLDVTVPAGAPDPSLVVISADGRPVGELMLGPGTHQVTLEKTGLAAGRRLLRIAAGDASTELELRVLPGWLSIVPPLLAIGLALIFKDVLISLYVGIFSGALILFDWNPLTAFARSIDHFILPSLADPDQAKIILFTTLLGGMVGVITRSGGTQGIVERLTPYATTSRRGQLATWVLGVLIFFDDYANTLIVGSTMRPITDRLRVSREKLAYMVDSTAAPVASIVPISTWIGFEVGLIAAAFTQLGLDFNAFTVFVESIPYRFYPLLALVLGFTIAASGRDFGPMLAAERRAADEGKLLRDGDQPLADYRSPELEPTEGMPMRALNAILPIATVVAVTLIGLFVTGRAAVAAMADPPEAGTLGWWRDVFAESNSFDTLMWAALAGVVVGIALPLVQRLLSVRQAMSATVEGFKAMLLALVVLVLAWSIGAVCGELHTADWVVSITEGVLSPHWLPVLVFLISAAVAFSTGTSWGTMGILVPLVIPIAHGLALNAGLEPAVGGAYYVILLGTISSVLAGAVWGDHCSPISDTTILSSTASGSDHIAHVRTQLPYALSVGVLGMVVGDIPTAYGLPPWVSLVVGTVVIVVGVLWLGKKSD